MTVLAGYQDLRHQFARVARTTGVSLAYDSATNKITRASGSFTADGFTAGMTASVSGTASNDGQYTVSFVAPLVLTLSDALPATETTVSSIEGAEFELDGAEKWPVDLVRANGFSSTITMLPKPATQFPVEVTCNGLATDVAAGSSYVWYARQRTDDAALKWLDVSTIDSTRTGTVVIQLTDKAVADMGLAAKTSKLTGDQQVRVMRNVTLFVKRLSDGAIQFVDLLILSHGI
jgi:hypothetical protein